MMNNIAATDRAAVIAEDRADVTRADKLTLATFSDAHSGKTENGSLPLSLNDVERHLSARQEMFDDIDTVRKELPSEKATRVNFNPGQQSLGQEKVSWNGALGTIKALHHSNLMEKRGQDVSGSTCEALRLKSAGTESMSVSTERRRLSLIGLIPTNVTGSHGVRERRQSLANADTFISVEPIPRERRSAAFSHVSTSPSSSPVAAASAKERLISSASTMRSGTMTEQDVVLPGARARALSARQSVKLLGTKPDTWTRAFNVEYAPHSFNVRRKRGVSEIVTTNVSLSSSWTSGMLPSPSAGKELLKKKTRQRPWAEPRVLLPDSGGQVEIHYESCLPKQQWLQVKPKKFVFNHRHGTSFEMRSPGIGPKPEAIQEVTVWENPYHILLLEKSSKEVSPELISLDVQP